MFLGEKVKSPLSPQDYQYTEIQPQNIENLHRSTSPFVTKNISTNIQAKAMNFVHTQRTAPEKKYLLSPN